MKGRKCYGCKGFRVRDEHRTWGRCDSMLSRLNSPSLRFCGAARTIQLRPRALKVLTYLAERPGETVTSKELIESLWDDPSQASNNSLAQCITDIRAALDDTDHRIIRNVPRRGYVLAAPVSTVEAARRAGRSLERACARRSQHCRADLKAAGSAPAKIARAVAALTLAAVLLAGGGWALLGWAEPSGRTHHDGGAVHCGAACQTARQDDTGAALATLADEIAAGVWRAARGFDTDIRPTSAVKDALADPKTTGRDLRVRYIVHNLARREADDLHIHVELIEADSVRQIWVGAFDYRMGQPGSPGPDGRFGWPNACRRVAAGRSTAPVAGEARRRALHHARPRPHD